MSVPKTQIYITPGRTPIYRLQRSRIFEPRQRMQLASLGSTWRSQMRRREFIAGLGAAVGGAVLPRQQVSAHGSSAVAHRLFARDGLLLLPAEHGEGPPRGLVHGCPES